MKAWFTAVILMTLASGGLTGYYVGKNAPRPAESADPWKGHMDELRDRGVTKQEDLDRARDIYVEYDARVRRMRQNFEELYRDQLSRHAAEATRKIQEIIDKY